ncbi:MAG: hypothetical protein J5960_02815 [Desulfovibrio sp.]|nr:hypothetical protein [Desulfovibrio sp.]
MLFLLTLLHFAVDGLCGAALAAHDQGGAAYVDILRLFALYNLIAFGGQWLAGLVLDLRPRRLPAALPLAVLALGAGLLPGLGWMPQAICLGAGNCLFHAAGGSLVLRRYDTYAAPGIFVSSGAVGLALGLNSVVPPPVFLALCATGTAATLVVLRRQGLPPIRGSRNRGSGSRLPQLACILLLLGCVTLRGFGGGGGGGAASRLLLFPCVFALGKALGGLCCDHIGYGRTILAVFLLSFLALQVEGLLCPLLLALAFNMTMPLTLRLAHWCCPAYPGLMFGLAAGCLLPGAFLGGLALSVPPHVMAVAVFLSLFAAGELFRRSAPGGAGRMP